MKIARRRIIGGIIIAVVATTFVFYLAQPHVPDWMLFGGDACPDNPKVFCGAFGGLGAVLIVPCFIYGMLVAHVSERTPSIIEVVR